MEEDNDIQQIVTIVRSVIQLAIEGFICVSVHLGLAMRFRVKPLREYVNMIWRMVVVVLSLWTLHCTCGNPEEKLGLIREQSLKWLSDSIKLCE